MQFLSRLVPTRASVSVFPERRLEGVYHGTAFLKDVNLRKKEKIGEKVAVIGGGNVAIDAARIALRCGSNEVVLVYRRSRDEMPAYPEEVEAAEGRRSQDSIILTSPPGFWGRMER